jgi:hypothetical protein
VAITSHVLAWNPTELPPGFTVEKQGVPVELEGKTLFQVRINTKTETAQQIAYRLSERIKKLAQDPTFNPQSITVLDTPLGSDIMAGDQVIVPVWAFSAKVEGRPQGVGSRHSRKDPTGRCDLPTGTQSPGPGFCGSQDPGGFDSFHPAFPSTAAAGAPDQPGHLGHPEDSRRQVRYV